MVARWFRSQKQDSPGSGDDQGSAPPKHGTVAERRAYTESRRAAAHERDRARFELAPRPAEPARLVIEPGRGFATAPPGGMEPVAGAVRAANDLIDGIGHDGLTSRKLKGGFLAAGLVPEEELTLESPYLRLALDESVLGSVTAYLGLVPVLNRIDVWYSVPVEEAPRSSQQWHLDHADTTQVKVFVHCNDVGPESGPLTVLDAAASDALAERVHYDFGEGYRLPDANVDELAGDGLTELVGPAGAADLVDTSRCFHMGSRVQPGAPPRRMVLLQYLTPYAFAFSDHRDEAPYRHLATGESSELERLVLGVA